MTLKDAEQVGGTGSTILNWSMEEGDLPHHPVPGIYSKEDANK